MSQDLYGVLGVSKSASDAEIKRAYRGLARQYHPDVNKEAGADQKFKDIQRAYAILSDSQKRAQYDQFGITDDQPGAGAGAGAGFGGFSGFEGFDDIFDSFFGGQKQTGGRGGRSRRQVHQGEDLRFDLELTLEQVAQASSHDIVIHHMGHCGDCSGSGVAAGTSKVSCPECNGQGEIHAVQRTMLGSFTQVMTCPACQGMGEVIKTPCKKCSGSGVKKERKTLNVDVPAGVDNGVKLRVTGEGSAGRGGGPSGDLYVYISVKNHSIFEREGDDIYLEIDIPVSQLILGASVKVPTLESDSILRIPAGTQSHTKFRLKGKGIPHLNGYGRGDQYILVKATIPKKLSDKETKLLQAFSTLRQDEKAVDKVYSRLTNQI